MDEKRRTPQEMMQEEPVQGYNNLEDTMMEEADCAPEQDLRAEHMPPIMAAGQVRMTEDRWRHRDLNMRCFTCMWFSPKVLNNPSSVGRCRRHSPTLNGYPAVYGLIDWCGDHKVAE